MPHFWGGKQKFKILKVMKTNYSTLKAITEFCKENLIDFKEVIRNMVDEIDDFESDDYRFIHQDSIDEIQRNELKSDTYFLGCFNADFLADIIDMPYKAICALQKSGCYSELGEICEDYINEIQSKYACADGYGHHFSHYDGDTIENLLPICGYYVFRVN